MTDFKRGLYSFLTAVGLFVALFLLNGLMRFSA